jgi:hypothetical protein
MNHAVGLTNQLLAWTLHLASAHGTVRPGVCLVGAAVLTAVMQIVPHCTVLCVMMDPDPD